MRSTPKSRNSAAGTFMAGRRAIVPRNFKGTRRATDWVASSVETAVTSLAAATAVLDQTLDFAEPGTVVRTRGQIMVQTDQDAGTETPFGALGMAIVSDQAAAIGITAVPTPTTDQASDAFFMWQALVAPMRFASAVGIHQVAQVFEFDSKAMRKFDENETLIVVVENASSSAAMQFLMQFRQLIKLH